jgi:type I restriction enzyme R subunit
MRAALNNLNADLARQDPDYVCRVTADEGDVGRGHMQHFQDIETRAPVILTTSQLLTTGLDAPTCRNVVLVRLIHSMVEFKQIIGRGTRVRDDYGKLWFNIFDYTGAATRNFTDPDFDGDPVFAVREIIDEEGQTQEVSVETPEAPEDDPVGVEEGTSEEPPSVIIDPPPGEPRKFYFDGGHVEIASELVHELDAEGKQLRVVQLTDYTAEKVRVLCSGPDDLRAHWSDAGKRADILQKLAERGIDFPAVAEQAGQPEADPFDLLCHLAYNAPILTRRQRADRVKREEAAFFGAYGEEARAILGDLLEKYAVDGEIQFTLPEVLQIPPINRYGNVPEIIEKFGGAEPLRAAIHHTGYPFLRMRTSHW